MAASLLPVLYVFAAILGFAFLVVLIWKPVLGVYAVFVFNLTFPQAGYNLNVGIQTNFGEKGIHFNVHEIIFWTVWLAVFIRMLYHILLHKPDWKALYRWFGDTPMSIPIFLYFATTVISGFVGMLNGGEFLVLMYRFIRTAPFFLVYFMVLNLVKTRKQFQALVIIFLICATLIACLGILQYALGQNWTEQWFSQKLLKKLGYPDAVNYVAGGGEFQAFRVNSTLLHPNVLGAYLLLALTFIVSLMSMMWKRRRWYLLALLAACLALNIVCLYLTGSRAAWVAAGLIFLIYGAFGALDRRVFLVAVTAVLVIALLFVLVSPPEFIKKRFVSLSAKEAAKARVFQYKMAVDLFMAHPFLGLGVGMEGQYVKVNNVRCQWAAVENAFLTYLVGEGLVGLAAFLLLFLVFWYMMLRARFQAGGDDFIFYNSEALFLGMLGIFVASQFGAWLLFAIPMWTLFWFFLGMAGSLYRIFREERGAHGPTAYRRPILP